MDACTRASLGSDGTAWIATTTTCVRHVCYLNGVHDKDHAFMRFHISNDRTNGTNIGKRSDADENKIRSKGMFPGALVKQGRDWTLDNELGSKVGGVVGLTSWENVPRSAVLVKWDNSLEIKHRLGYEGKMDLTLVQAGNGPFYYKDHLPVVSTINRPQPAFAGGNELKKGDMVKTELDVETLKQMAEGHGGWVDDMAKVIGQVGRVSHIDQDGDVHVRYGATKWVFHPEALCKATDLRKGDKVRVASNKETVENLQDGHGGWNSSMTKALGKVGKVIKVDDDGDVVVSIEGNVWLFNPNVLTLESKEDERVPAGQEDPSDSSTTALELLLHAKLEALLSNASSSSGTVSVEDILFAVIAIGDLDKVRQIIGDNKALVNHKCNSKQTPLQVACHQGKPEIVSYLLENGADKELKDGQNYTALHHAAYGDETGVCVVVMLSANAQANPTDLDGTTPLHLAVQRGNEAAVAALVQSEHCDVNFQDKLGDTPLHEAILHSQNSIFTYLLEAQNLDPTICNANGFNILHLATLKDCQHPAKLLIERFPELVDIAKEDGFSALHVAALNNHHEIAKHLILSGHCAINLQNEDGMTALALAVSRSHKQMIELLIEHKADVNMEDKEGDTPLHVAVMKHCIEYANLGDLGKERHTGVNVEKAIALFLVTRGGARTDYTNHQGKTPLDLCIDEDLKGMLWRQDAVRRNRQPSVPQTTLASPAAGPRYTSPSVQANPIIPSSPPSLPTQQDGTASASPAPAVSSSARAPSPRTTGPHYTAPSVQTKPIFSSSPPLSALQEGGTQVCLTTPALPVLEPRTPSSRMGDPQSTAPPVPAKPNRPPSSPSSSPTQQGGTLAALAIPTPPVPASRTPSSRMGDPQSTAPPVPAKPNRPPSSPSSSPTQQGGILAALAIPTPLVPAPRTPSSRMGDPQSTAPPVPAKSNRPPTLPSSSPTKQGGKRDDLAAPAQPVLGSTQTPSPRMVGPQSTAPSLRPKPTRPPSSSKHFQAPLAPFPGRKPIPPPKPPSLQVAKGEGRVISPGPIDTGASPRSEVSTGSTDSSITAPGPAPGPSASPNAEASPAGDIPMALANFNLKDDTPAPNVAGACSVESERRNPNLEIASQIQTSSIEKTKMVESQKSNVQDEQCHFCEEEEAVVIFEPCNHKVLCQSCSVRARVCLLCREKVTKKIAPGTNSTLSSLSDIKKAYEKITELDRLANCQICMEDTPSNVVFRPCGHKSCSKCADRLYKCHSCSVIIKERIKTYQ